MYTSNITPRKANIVIDALSHRPYPTLNHLLSILTNLSKVFKRLEINVVVTKGNALLFMVEVRSTLAEEIRATQEIDRQLMRLKMEVLEDKALRYVIHEDETLSSITKCLSLQWTRSKRRF